MGLPRAGRSDQEDVALLDSHIVQIRIGDDRIRSAPIPAIDETLEMIRDTQGEASLGDVLPDDVLVEVGKQGLGGRDRRRGVLPLMVAQEAGLAPGRAGVGAWSGPDRLSGAEAADAGGWIEAAIVEREVRVEAEVFKIDTRVRSPSISPASRCQHQSGPQ